MLTSGSAGQSQEDNLALTKGHRYAIAAGIRGWTLDAFHFFVVVFIVDILAEHFAVNKSAAILTIVIPLAMRPVGALLFGMLADRYGRRRPLMAVVAYFSLIELLTTLLHEMRLWVDVGRGLLRLLLSPELEGSGTVGDVTATD